MAKAKDPPTGKSAATDAQRAIEKYQDSSSIEDARNDAIREQRGFKGAKGHDSEWLTKKNAVRSESTPFYAPYEGKVKR